MDRAFVRHTLMEINVNYVYVLIRDFQHLIIHDAYVHQDFMDYIVNHVSDSVHRV